MLEILLNGRKTTAPLAVFCRSAVKFPEDFQGLDIDGALGVV